MKRSILALTLGLSLCLSGCAGSGVMGLRAQQLPPPVEAKADGALDLALTELGLDLLRQTHTEGESAFLSPLSVVLCLSMAANGAQGDTLAQFEQVLAGGQSLAALNANCASLLGDYLDLEGETELLMANSLWLDERVRAEDAFVGRCTDTYQAEVFAADFTSDATRQRINQWISEHTEGKIENALDEIDTRTVLALANAVYFEGKWENEFDPGDTRADAPFYLADGTQAQVDMMSNATRAEQYILTEQEAGVLLPYQDGRLAFMALLPAEGTDLTTYLETLDAARLTTLLAQAKSETLSLRMPKFKLMWKDSLAETMQALGLTNAFDPGLADFTPMGTDEAGNALFLGALTHGAGIEVEEQGTKAYAFSFGTKMGAAMPTNQLTLDRPFLYGIVDLERGVPLFIGAFEGP